MNDARKQIQPADRERLAKRVAELEKRTDAEVVCAVASESGRYDRAESFCGLLMGLVALISGNKIVAMGDWDPAAAASLSAQVGLVVGGFLAGSVLASYWHAFRRLLVSSSEMVSEVTRSVHQVFSQQGIGGTRHRGGLLIYLSLFERRLEIRCDSVVRERISTADLEAVRGAVLAEVRQGRVVDGLMAGLDRAEPILAKVLPHSDTAEAELSNEVLLFHPRP